jgi:hypothetical protein
MGKHHYKLLILIFVLIAAFGILFVKLSAKPPKIDSPAKPMPVAEAQAPDLTSVGSPDGEATLTMKKEKVQDGTLYTFFTTDSVTGNQNVVFTKTVSSGDTLSIPANTFSPDDKYIFLKEENSGQTDFFAITKSGALDISGPFATKYPNLKLTDVTGWGGMALLVVNTVKSDGSLGPSFWFEVPAGGFIQLADRFN